MDPATGGTFISLSENEQRCYSGLHALCQADSSGKLSASKVAELFRASQLPNEILHQVTEVCGAKRLGFFASGQFYVALKLLAAAQAGLPVRLESVSGELPLPMFVGIKNEGEGRFPNHSHSGERQTPPLSTAAGSAPWPTADRPTLRHPDTSTDTQEPWSQTQSPHPSPSHSPPAYHSYPYAMPRNGTDSLLACEGQLLQSGAGQENTSPCHYTLKPAAEPPTLTQAVSVELLVEQAEVEYLDDPWRMTAEQRDYYTHQFHSLQPDLGGLILGTVAKNFFTKSKLPILELSHIWELSDEDRDGALSFPEFCTAFHLVVARKNGYPLPERLPPTLGAACREHGLPPPPQNTQPLIVFDDSATPRPAEMGVVSQQEAREGVPKQEFSPKRTAAAQDQPLLQTSTLKPGPPQELDLNVKSRTRPRSYSSTSIDDAMKKVEEPPTPPPRPQKTHSRASSLDLNKLHQQGSQGGKSLAPPPALPPRPPASQMTHFLPDKNSQQAMQQHYFADFSKLREEEEAGVASEGVGSLRAEDPGAPMTDSTMLSHNHVPQKPVRRKLHPECQNATPPLGGVYSSSTPATVSKPTQRLPARQKREIQTAIRKNRETNAVLTRLNSELQQQLKEVHQQRVTLESQLELLRPVAST